MPKLRNVTAHEIAEAVNAAEDVSAICTGIVGRVQQGYCDEVDEPVTVASSLLSASRSLADLAHAMLIKGRLQEQKATLERTLRSRS